MDVRPGTPCHFGYNGRMSSLNLASDLPRTADLVVIGGGIAGLATAFFAARAGIRAVVLEKRPALCSLTTPVSVGAFRAQFDNPEEIALVREGITLYEHFADVTGLPGYDLALRRQGYLWLATLRRPRAASRRWSRSSTPGA